MTTPTDNPTERAPITIELPGDFADQIAAAMSDDGSNDTEHDLLAAVLDLANEAHQARGEEPAVIPWD